MQVGLPLSRMGLERRRDKRWGTVGGERWVYMGLAQMGPGGRLFQRLNQVVVSPSGGAPPSGGGLSSPPAGLSEVGAAHAAGLPLHVSPSAHSVIMPPLQKPCTSGLARQVWSGSLHSLQTPMPSVPLKHFSVRPVQLVAAVPSAEHSVVSL